jgi:hypothetical protein
MEPITTTITTTEVATPIPGAQQVDVLARLDPWMLTLIILGVLVALMLSLWMVYSYVNRVRTTDIHRQMLYDSVFESRYRRLLVQAGLTDEFYFEGDDPSWLKRERVEMEGRRQSLETAVAKLEAVEEKGLALSDEEREELDYLKSELLHVSGELQERLSEENISVVSEEWQKQEREHKDRIRQIREQAQKDATALIPESLSVAGMGITGSFFIELTAILTIIFGIIILGLVGVLSTQEIAPILAAIAGYVLGKTTSGWAPYGGAAGLQQPPRSQAPASSPLSSGAGGEGRS